MEWITVNNTTEWYHKLQKPSWAPADNVYGIVWGIIYPIIIVVNIFVLVLVFQHKVDWRIGLIFWLNLIFNLLFTPLQFSLKNSLLAMIDIILVFVTIILAMVVMWPYNHWLSVAFVPYLIWVGIATILQVSITWLNR